eukprot:TRINITY_DN14257_c0_g1_i1.p1 TRINITY_DN14257_c0_g1~~TRINITY_DN14257_c0_g1_i1.p1  ORF type:complete len:292 (-),score=66.04 TRINITY_DN14257_c0_g1_i1:44-919(-)
MSRDEDLRRLEEELLPLQEVKEDAPLTRRQFVIKWTVRMCFILFLCGCLGILIWLFVQPKKMAALLEFIHGIGIWGNLICVLLLVLAATPVGTGYTEIAIACGFLYQLLLGTATVFVGTVVLGSTISFFLCQFLLKEPVLRYINRKQNLRLLMKAVRANGFPLIFMMRLTPVPMGIQNALFAVSDISFPVFISASALGLLPEMIVWVYMGTTFKSLQEMIYKQGDPNQQAENNKKHKIIMGIQLGVTVILFILMFIIGRKVLKKAMDKQRDEEQQSFLDHQEDYDVVVNGK